MSFTLDGTTLIVLAVVAIVVVVLLSLWVARHRKTRALKRDFGPEYDHQVSASKSRGDAENELLARRRRVRTYELHELSSDDKARFTNLWRELQKTFVDRPNQAVDDASRLVEEAMERRGYPMGEIQRREADLSVDYPSEVQDYRRARQISDRNRQGEASTEELREAIVCYRRLFAHLAGVDERLHTEKHDEKFRDTRYPEHASPNPAR